MKASLIISILLLKLVFAFSQNTNEKFTSHFIEIEGLSVHYLDFGGEGLPVILLHSEGWSAYTHKDFGPLLTENNKVLAFTRPGYGDSERGRYDIPGQGDYLITFLDALGIEKAVFMGNSSSSLEMTYLAENYPERVVGLVYLSGVAIPFLDEHLQDSTRAFEMYARAGPGADNREEILYARRTYRPKHLTSDTVKIGIPAMAIFPKGGALKTPIGTATLLYAGSLLVEDIRNDFAPSPLKEYLERLARDADFRNQQMSNIQDSVAREYFVKLANDIEAQKKVYAYYKSHIQPAELNAKQSFIDAFGEYLQIVKLDIAEVSGYEYRDNPELITEHVKDFLKGLNSRYR
jgi:pimeloyl-ACP methyl ester carboxylesterase